LKIISKNNNNNGSAMVLAIILMFLVSIVIVMFSSQISNGFKVTNRNYEDLRAKYMLEAGIENAIAEMYTEIENQYKNDTSGVVFSVPAENIDLISPVDKNITIEIPEIESKNENLKYKVNQINFGLTLLINKYKIKEYGQHYYYVNYLYGTKFNPQQQSIIVETTQNGKKYKMEAIVAFSITDLKAGTIKYLIKSWEQVH
jgi:hypothetical protein